MPVGLINASLNATLYWKAMSPFHPVALWDQVSEAIHRVLMDSLETSDSLAENGDILLNVKI